MRADSGSRVAVEMTGITKQFGTVRALDSVGIRVQAGSIHGIVGENGAGKSTLMKVLYGAYRADSGSVIVNGKNEQFRTSAEAISAGIGMVSQHYGIIGELSRLDNLILGAEPSSTLNRSEIKKRANELALPLGLKYSDPEWDEPAGGISASEAQRLEILKLLWRRAQVMILDEPTAMLSPSDGEALFANLRELADGGTTILLVTHRLPEIMDHCERVTVLRGGKFIADREVTDTHPAELAELIVGRAITEPKSPAPVATTEVALEIRTLRTGGPKGLRDVNLCVRPGELIGIAGVDGSGQAELMRALFGLENIADGDVLWRGERVTHDGPIQRSLIGWRLLPEDRISQGIVADWSLEENAMLGLQRHPDFAGNGAIRTDQRNVRAKAFADRFAAKYGHLKQAIGELSGGNQQRFVAARMTETSPTFFFAFQPSRGLDIAATRDLYRAMQDRCAEGACGLVVSFDLDELQEHCHRVCVMYSGKLFDPGPDATRDELGALMVGGASA